MVKRKVEVRRPRWRERVLSTVRESPWTWGTAASIAGVVSVVVSGVFWVGAHFQTVEAADAHEKQDAKDHAETVYGQARIETFVLRSQVNECLARTLRAADKLVCDGYRREYEEAENRMQALYKATLKLNK